MARSKEARDAGDAGNKKMHEDPEMREQMKTMAAPPFNMQRMIFGGFAAVVDEKR